ncbi:MAG TPA: TIM44-like domain-containing protein [Rhodoplanes sp.]|nr:TIM44-like domain-containing protein [Rhodoplanes sp.]
MLRFHLRPLLARLALVSGLALGAADYADARVGGGSSFGSRGSRTFSAPPSTRTAPGATAPMERSVIQPGAQTRPTPGMGGTFNRPGLFGGGLLGGLAAGFLGAGLLGLLFGHGLFGGLAGFASVLGLLLQIGLVALVGVLLFRMWQGRRRQPAMAGGPPLRDFGLNRSGLGSLGGGGAASGWPAASAGGLQPVEIGPADYQAFERLLGEIQAAYSAEDLNALRARVTPEMLSYFSEELAQNASRGVVNKVSDVKLDQGDLAEAWREGDAEYATVAMRYSLVDRTVDRSSGRLVGGSDEPKAVTEVWTFRRAHNGAWLLSAIQQTR